MTTVADILKYIETLAPTYMKMDWDNVGLEHLCDDLSRAFAEARERTCGRLGERGQDALRLAFWQAGAGNENESFRHSLSIVTGGGQARMETFPTPHLVSP